MGRVEREGTRLQVLDHGPVVRAGVALAEPPLLEGRRLVVARDRGDHHDALAQAQARLDGVGETRGVGVRHGQAGLRIDRAAQVVARPVLRGIRAADDEPVHHDLDRVALVLVERGRLRQVVLDAIDADTDEALLAGGLEDAITLGLAVLDEGAQDQQARALGEAEDLVDDLAHRLPLDLAAAVGAVRVPDAREQEAQVVVDLGDRADGGPRVLAGALLVDGDGGREAVDLVDVGLLHLAQELPGVGAQALDIAALALSVDGVERKAGLAAPGQAGDHDQPVTRERDGDVLQVVLARSAHDDPILGHGRSLPDLRKMEQSF